MKQSEVDRIRAEDAEARRVAQTVFGHPIVLEAGAGTGKTTTLVARVVAWAVGLGWERVVASEVLDLTGGSPDERAERIAAEVLSRIAAITFTDAAAAEMAERVGRAFADMANGDTPQGLLAEAIPSDTELCARRGRALVGALDHLVVRTIHAWCRRLLARHPLAAGVHPTFEVDADEEVQAAVAREVVEDTLRDSLSGGQGRGLVRLAEDGRRPDELEQVLLTLIGQGIEPTQLSASPWTEERVGAAAARLEDALDTLVSAEAGALDDARGSVHRATLDAAHATLARLREGRPHDVGSAAELTARIRELWPDNAIPRLVKWSRSDFTASEAAGLGERAPAVSDAARRAIDPARHWRELDPHTFERVREAVAPLLERASDELRRRGVLTFSDLLRGARNLLRDCPAVLRQTRRDLDLLLVDELQDTDPVQCEIVTRLALEGPADERPSLFLVGDPKQSIYGWRSADLRAYAALVRSVCDQNSGVLYRLSVNFRSAPSILDEVERVIAPIMREDDGVQPAFQPLLPSEHHLDATGFAEAGFAPVEHWVSWGLDPVSGELDPRQNFHKAAQTEARAMTADIASLHTQHAVPWSDVAVLLRNNTDLELYLEALREGGVPYAVERDRSYFQRREVIEAAAAVRCVLDPNDTLALLTLMRSATVGVPDVALIPLWTRGFPDDVRALHTPDRSALDSIRRKVEEVAAGLPAVPGLDRVTGWEWSLLAAIESLGVLRRDFEAGASDRFVERLRQLLLLDVTEAGRYLGRYRAGNLERFFRELTASLAAGGDPNALLRQLRGGVAERRDAEEGRPQDEEVEAVRVMTIHKAKGLDFAHVYLPQLHKKQPTSDRVQVHAGELDGHLEYRLFGASTPGYDGLQRARIAVEAAERVRALYVGVTRAEARLVLMGLWMQHPTPVAPDAARSMLDLLASRRDLPESPGDLVSEQVSHDVPAWTDEAGARWRLAARTADGQRPAEADQGSGLADAEKIASHAKRLAVRRERARERMARPRSLRASGFATESVGSGDSGDAAASADSPAEARERRGEHAFSATASVGAERVWPGSELAREASRVAGTTVHQILESWDLSADSSEELARQRQRVASLLEGAIGAGARPKAEARVHELLESFASGPLLQRLREVAPHVIARELPLLRAPGAAPATETGGVVAYETGTLDLVYADEATGDWVVVDYKTDRAASDEERAAKAARYRGQGAFYSRALAEALSLERAPRFELWFLDAGRIEPVELSPTGDHA